MKKILVAIAAGTLLIVASCNKQERVEDTQDMQREEMRDQDSDTMETDESINYQMDENGKPIEKEEVERRIED